MASHEELISELPKLDKLSNAARLKQAKKRRLKQLKRYQDFVRQQRALSSASVGGSSIMKKRSPTRIMFERGSILNDMVSRNELLEVRQLLEGGLDPNISNADGLTPLHKCCIDNTLELAQILLEFGAELNARDIEGWTPLHAAAATGNLQMINLLLDEGASLTAINLDDKMPVDVSADSDIRYILQQKMLEAGYTDDVLGYLRVSVPKNMLADLKDSVKQGRSINLQDRYGATALHVAAANGYVEVLEFLLSQDDIQLDIQDTEGWTPFHAAVCWEQQDAMRQLAEKGANMDIKNLHGETAYAIAEEPEIREYILQLKTEFGTAAERSTEDKVVESPEELGPRTRRLSVRRVPQADKTNKMKDSIKEEALIRRASMVKEDKDRGMMAKQSSELPAGAEDGEGPVELTSIRSLSTGDDMDVTSDPTASPPASPADSEVKSPDSQLGSDKPPDEGAASAIGGEGEGGGERVQSTNKQEDEGVRERPKLDTQKSTQSALQRPESLEIDDQLAPNLSRMRKSNLRKSRPTPVNTGPTYTVTSPVGEPYDSSGQRRTRGSQECCCLM